MFSMKEKEVLDGARVNSGVEAPPSLLYGIIGFEIRSRLNAGSAYERCISIRKAKCRG
jgi:hypothetical protein